MQDRRGCDLRCFAAFVFLLQALQDFAFGGLHLSCAQGAVGAEQIAASQSCVHRAFDVAVGVFGIAEAAPGQRLFEEVDLAALIEEEFGEEALPIVVRDVPPAH